MKKLQFLAQLPPLREPDIVSVHLESTPHIQAALQTIRSKGARAGLAINPGTPLSAITALLPDIDVLLLMTVNPGFAGQCIVPQCFDKVKQARAMLDRQGYEDILIETDGNCSFANVPKLYTCGAGLFVVGSSSVFHPDYTIETAANKLIDACRA